jgi:hypothetical protein
VTANKKKERRRAAKERSQQDLDLDAWFWVSAAMIVPYMAMVSIADWAKELYDRTFIWGAVPDNRKKKRNDDQHDA